MIFHPPRGSSSRARLAAFLLVVLTSLAVFAPALGNDLLLWDDAGYIWQNPHIQSLGWHTVAGAFGEYWCNYWAPLTWLSLAVDHAVWGLNPIGYHLTNVVLHAIDSGLFLLLSLQLARRHLAGSPSRGRDPAERERLALWSSVLAVLVFAVHPLRVESVAWATERKDVLALFFGIPAIMAWIRHATPPVGPAAPSARTLLGFSTSPHYWVAFVLFCLSLLSKQLLVTLPLILLILDWVPLDRLRRAEAARLVAEKAPFLLASFVVTLISLDAQGPQAMPLSQSGVTSRLLNALRSIASYLWLTVWPERLSPFYLHPGNITHVGPEYLLAAAVVLLVTAACAVLVRRRPLLMAVWLAYLTALIPVLGFTQVGPQAMAARFTYFASLPVSILIGAAIVTTLLDRSRRWKPLILGTAGALWLLTLAGMTVRHISFWKDDVTLWTRVIELSPHASGRAYAERSAGWVRKGQPLLALNDLDDALAIARSRGYGALHELYVERAMILSSLGQPSEAIADYTRALASARGEARAGVLMGRGSAYRELGEEALAAADFEAAAAGR
jgi:hypothetical protein